MATVILGELPEFDALLERRRELGQDGPDEIWDGVYYLTPHADARHAWIQGRLVRVLGPLVEAHGFEITVDFNLGERSDFRVPDLGVHTGAPTDLYLPTAVAVIEVLSADDKTFEKLPFYAAHGVAEVIIVDPQARTVEPRQLVGDGYQVSEWIDCAGISAAELAALISWI